MGSCTQNNSNLETQHNGFEIPLEGSKETQTQQKRKVRQNLVSSLALGLILY